MTDANQTRKVSTPLEEESPDKLAKTTEEASI